MQCVYVCLCMHACMRVYEHLLLTTQLMVEARLSTDTAGNRNFSVTKHSDDAFVCLPESVTLFLAHMRVVYLTLPNRFGLSSLRVSQYFLICVCFV